MAGSEFNVVELSVEVRLLDARAISGIRKSAQGVKWPWLKALTSVSLDATCMEVTPWRVERVVFAGSSPDFLGAVPAIEDEESIAVLNCALERMYLLNINDVG